ncbi:TPA: hypothetical protein HA274_04430 [Candidatus Bathyarchaeota archaeon]|nr:hypothetical protein [Candidatus Bathyarchaeota archaeon]
MSTETFLLPLAILATLCSKNAALNPRTKARAKKTAGKNMPAKARDVEAAIAIVL